MDMKLTDKGTKKFSDKEKLAILMEASEQGVKVTLEKYDIYPATYYYWKRKHAEVEASGLNSRGTKELRAELKVTRVENDHLKRIVAEQALELRMKDELLKKKYPSRKPR